MASRITSDIHCNDNESIVTLKLPLKYYRAAVNMAYLLGYKSLDEYVSYTVKDNVDSHIESTQLWDSKRERHYHEDGYIALTTDFLTGPPDWIRLVRLWE